MVAGFDAVSFGVALGGTLFLLLLISLLYYLLCKIRGNHKGSNERESESDNSGLDVLHPPQQVNQCKCWPASDKKNATPRKGVKRPAEQSSAETSAQPPQKGAKHKAEQKSVETSTQSGSKGPRVEGQDTAGSSTSNLSTDSRVTFDKDVISTHPEKFIACQAPLRNTVDDMYTMIWDKNTKVVVNLTGFVERKDDESLLDKCENYLPGLGTPKTVELYGEQFATAYCQKVYGISVSIQNASVRCYELANLNVEPYDNEGKVVYTNLIATVKVVAIKLNDCKEHKFFLALHYLRWPLRGAPESDAEIQDFFQILNFSMWTEDWKEKYIDLKGGINGRLGQLMDKSLNPTTEQSFPLVVHCSAGTGRTGTYIVIRHILNQFKLNRQIPNIKEVVEGVRRYRYGAVQTNSQYKFIFMFMHMLLPLHEFTEIGKIQLTKMKERGLFGGVKAKDRYGDVKPLKTSMISIPNANDFYINADVVSTLPEKFIACQGPLPNTVNDMYTMIWHKDTKLVVNLTGFVEDGKIKCENYLPGLGTPKTVELYGKQSATAYCLKVYGISVSVDNAQSHYYLEVLKAEPYCDDKNKSLIATLKYVTIMLDDSKTEKSFLALHYLKWPDHGAPESDDEIQDFSQFLNFSMWTDDWQEKYIDLKGDNDGRLGQLMDESLNHTTKQSLPIAVHCSAGIGRTGTYIVIRHMLNQFKLNRQIPTIKEVVAEVRSYRLGAVQSLSQYVFIHMFMESLIKMARFANPILGKYQTNVVNMAALITDAEPKKNMVVDAASEI